MEDVRSNGVCSEMRGGRGTVSSSSSRCFSAKGDADGDAKEVAMILKVFMQKGYVFPGFD